MKVWHWHGTCTWHFEVISEIPLLFTQIKITIIKISHTSLYEFCQQSHSGPLMGVWVLSPKPPTCDLPSCRHYPALAAKQSACRRGRLVSPSWRPEWEPHGVPTPVPVWRSGPSSGSLGSHRCLSGHQYLDGIISHKEYTRSLQGKAPEIHV